MPDFIQKNIKRTLLLIVVLFLLALVLGLFFESQIIAFSETLLQNVHPLLLGAFVALNDCIISAVPPDIILFLISRSDAALATQTIIYIGFLGFCSSIGGALAWFIAKKFGKPSWFGERFSAFILEHKETVNRYGRLAVALAAVTPLPFSIICWVSGFVRMRFQPFFLMALLRIPRFLVYYLILVSSSDVTNWIRRLFE